MTARITAKHQLAPKRLEDNSYRLSKTNTTDISNYTFIVNSYQPLGTNPSVKDKLIPIVVSRVNRSLAKQKPSVLRSVMQTPCGHGAGRRR